MNVKNRQLEMHREPRPMPERPLSFGHADVRVFGEDAVACPLARPDAIIRVADLF